MPPGSPHEPGAPVSSRPVTVCVDRRFRVASSLPSPRGLPRFGPSVSAPPPEPVCTRRSRTHRWRPVSRLAIRHFRNRLESPLPFGGSRPRRIKAFNPIWLRKARLPTTPDCPSLPATVLFNSVDCGSPFRTRYVSGGPLFPLLSQVAFRPQVSGTVFSIADSTEGFHGSCRDRVSFPVPALTLSRLSAAFLSADLLAETARVACPC